MSSPNASRHTPQVQHSFDGDVKVLNGTFDRRTDLRKTLTILAQDVQKIEGAPTQVKAEIKLQVGGQQPRQHVYSVTITDGAFDIEEFERVVPASEDVAAKRAPSASNQTAGSPPPQANGQRSTPAHSTPRPASRKADDDDVVDIRPFKRPRTDGELSTPASGQPQDADSMLKEILALSKQWKPGRVDELFSFMKEWHAEWVRQGGWLFDNVSKTNSSTDGSRAALEKKLAEVQDVLGQSLNTASASTLAELSNIAKLIPWLENCRKTNADKVQAREEKWRSSSATFHDQTRRDREAAEKRIEKKLEEQRGLLMKVAQANGLDVDEDDTVEEKSPDRSREESLGAQLTAELNTEAEKSRSGAQEPIHIED